MNSGLYVRAGDCATARLAACAISLFGPITNDSNVLRGLSPSELPLAGLVSRPDSVCFARLMASISSTGDSEEMNLIPRGSPNAVSAADNFCQSWLHFSSIGDLLTVLHNRHTGGCTRDSELGPNETFLERRIRSKHQKTGKNAKISKIRGKTGTQLPGNETL